MNLEMHYTISEICQFFTKVSGRFFDRSRLAIQFYHIKVILRDLQQTKT